MYTFTQRLLGNIDQVREALKHEPAIRPDFSKADIQKTVQIMLAAMMNGTFDAPSIYRYLEQRGCRFDRDTIYFLLNAFEGDSPYEHLWMRGKLGDYMPNTAPVPEIFEGRPRTRKVNGRSV